MYTTFQRYNNLAKIHTAATITFIEQKCIARTPQKKNREHSDMR